MKENKMNRGTLRMIVGMLIIFLLGSASVSGRVDTGIVIGIIAAAFGFGLFIWGLVVMQSNNSEWVFPRETEEEK